MTNASQFKCALTTTTLKVQNIQNCSSCNDTRLKYLINYTVIFMKIPIKIKHKLHKKLYFVLHKLKSLTRILLRYQENQHKTFNLSVLHNIGCYFVKNEFKD